MIYYDSHTHTSFSTDSDSSMALMIQNAISYGLKGITITDHMDYEFPMSEDYDTVTPFTFDLDSYFAEISRFKHQYHSKIQIRTGVEIGLKEDAYDKNVTLSHRSELDYTIGSIHLIDNMDPYERIYWESYEEKKALRRYFETMLFNIQHLGDIHIDTLGHLDYVVRYAPSGYQCYSYTAFSDIIDEILRCIIEKQISLEINTSGYKKSITMPNPNEDVLRRYLDLGGHQITFGSDAHAPEGLAYRFLDAEKLAKKTGFTHYTTFEGHKPVLHTL